MIKKIESGQAEIIGSGSVISFSGNPITITFGSSNETLKLIIEFKDEEGKNDIRIEASAPDTNTLKLTLINFRNPMGNGTIKPKPIGSLDGKRLYIHFRVNSNSRSADKMLHYTIYKGEEVTKVG